MCIDPCQGSGHILAYMFDVLVQIYEAYGYSAREAASHIVENNIWGLDIDDRASQLAYFSVMMKARQYDHRFFKRGIQPHVYSIVESNNLDPHCVAYFVNGRPELKAAMDSIVVDLHDAKEYGSIIDVTSVDFDALYARFDEIRNDISIYREQTLESLLPLVQIAQALTQKYHVVVTNPPYMGANGMGATLNDFVKKNYSDTKSDMSTVFMERALFMCKQNGFMAMINIPVWMFLSSYEKLRMRILKNNTYVNMVHPGRGIFGSDFGTTTFVISKKHIHAYKSVYQRLFDSQSEVQDVETREKQMRSGKGTFVTSQDEYNKIPGAPVAYWLKPKLVEAFQQSSINSIGVAKQGLATGDNNRFLRLWYEVNIHDIGFGMRSREDAKGSKRKWFPCNKGAYRKWYGNNEYVVNWYNDGEDIRSFFGENGKLRSRPQNMDYYFRKGITWSTLSIGQLSMRISPTGHMFETKGSVCFFDSDEHLYYVLGEVNTNIVYLLLQVLCPTVDFHEGPIGRIPVIIDEGKKGMVIETVKDCISLSISDWDSFESSWDFKRHPFIRLIPSDPEHRTVASSSGDVYVMCPIEHAFSEWMFECDDRFDQLKANEEELNRIFIDIYGLQDELSPEVEDKDVTVRKADLKRDIRSFISYAVGCMFGRYSLDVPGLAYAGGEWDVSKYQTFIPDTDAILPICDDEYFEDDIVGRFIKFVDVVYGHDTLEENLRFIADALGGSGTSREVIRNYFINDFYADHCKIYQKRPIYWLFDSGKKNGFKSLIYMHRYQPDTIARIRTDYVHEQQSRYRTAIADLENRISTAGTSERVKLTKQLNRIQDQAEELRIYEEKIHHLADQMISIDLDDGVKKNYAIFQDVLAKIK